MSNGTNADIRKLDPGSTLNKKIKIRIDNLNLVKTWVDGFDIRLNILLFELDVKFKTMCSIEKVGTGSVIV